MFGGRRAAEIQSRGNGLGVSSLVMKEPGIWHLELKVVEELEWDVGVTSCSSWCKTIPSSYVFVFEATKVLGKSRMDEARNPNRSRLVRGQAKSPGLKRFSAGV